MTMDVELQILKHLKRDAQPTVSIPLFLTKTAIAITRKLTASRLAPGVRSCCQTIVCC